jgi:GH15 family glucan-1,4-alpha-glucosidase
VAPDGSIDWLCVPRFDAPSVFGALLDRQAGCQTIRLRTDMELGVEGERARTRHTLERGDQVFCALSWAEGLASPETIDDAHGRLAATTHFWRSWLDHSRAIDHRWRGAIQRSALTIKGLTYMPTGATVAALDSILLHTRRSERLPRRLWPVVQTQAECAARVWRDPDQGIWEARGKPQHYVSSKLMCWVALDRAAKLATIRGDGDAHASWGATADEIKADILEHGARGGVLRQHYETDSLDASTLLAPILGFLPGHDELLHRSVDAIATDLTEDGFVLRYRTEETDDGLAGKEGSFLICSFWLVSALAVTGELQRARDLMERLLRVASPLGLYAEEFDTTTAQHLGNFPQAFSHLALIEAAGRIIVVERLEEYTT